MKNFPRWKTTKLLCLLLVSMAFYASALACGSPQPVSGKATAFDGITPIQGAIVQIQTVSGGEAQSVETDVNGQYQFQPVTACLEYQISIGHRSTSFSNPVRIFYVFGDAEGYEFNFKVKKFIAVELILPLFLSKRM